MPMESLTEPSLLDTVGSRMLACQDASHRATCWVRWPDRGARQKRGSVMSAATQLRNGWQERLRGGSGVHPAWLGAVCARGPRHDAVRGQADQDPAGDGTGLGVALAGPGAGTAGSVGLRSSRLRGMISRCTAPVARAGALVSSRKPAPVVRIGQRRSEPTTGWLWAMWCGCMVGEPRCQPARPCRATPPGPWSCRLFWRPRGVLPP